MKGKKNIGKGIVICLSMLVIASGFGSGIFVNDSENTLDGWSIETVDSSEDVGVISKNDWLEQDKLLASDGVAYDHFGSSVSINGDYAIVGALWDDDNGDNSGSAYIFTRSGSTWIQQSKLLASDGAAGDLFGRSVSINGDYAIVGAYMDDDNGDDSGSAYVFNRSGSTWLQQAKLLASDGAADDWFGRSVSINGDYAIVGAIEDDDNGINSGSAYVFTRSGSTWIQQSKLLASDGAHHDLFGYSVSINGDYVIVGAFGDDDNGADSGSAYIFTRSGTAWTQQAKLLASDGAAGDLFGYSVSIDGDYAIVGAHRDDDNGDASGSTYIFTRSGTAWTQQAKLLASDGAVFDWFGYSVSIDGDYAIVGAWGDNDNGDYFGSTYIFTRNGSNWTQQAKLLASDKAVGDHFGYSVSIDGDYAIIGAPWDNDNGADSGSAYVFKNNNNPPYVPSNPSPENNSINVDINSELSWTGGDPDPGDMVTYNVYFGTSSPPLQVVSNQSGTVYNPGTMIYNMKYYWKIAAWDNHGASTSGPEWDYFTTEELINVIVTELYSGWNLVGLPYNESLQKYNLIIGYNGTDYSWDNATTNNNEEGEPLILGFIYEWDRSSQNYELVDTLDPGYGYWIYACYNCSLKRNA